MSTQASLPINPVDEEEESKAALLQNFQQAWHEGMTGQTIPIAQLGEGIEDV